MLVGLSPGTGIARFNSARLHAASTARYGASQSRTRGDTAESPAPVIEGSRSRRQAGWRCHNAHHRETARQWRLTPDVAMAADAPTRHWPLTPDAASAPRAELIGRAKARGPTIANGS